MAKIKLTEEDLQILSDCINNQTEVPEDLLLKLSPGFFDKLRQAGKFDYKELDKYKVPTLEYAGKRPEIPDVVHNPSYPNLLRNKSILGSRLFLKASC